MHAASRALLSYASDQAQNPHIPQPTKLRHLTRLLKSTQLEYAKFKSGIPFRYTMCALIGVAFGVLCYYMFRRTAKSEDDEIDEGNDTECVVCNVNIRRVVFGPCLHIICCYECAEQVLVCPVCRVRIQNKSGIRRFLETLDVDGSD